MSNRLIDWAKRLATWLERLLALGILLGIVVFALHSIGALSRMPWGSTDTFYELVYRVLLLVIGVELIRTLVTHDLSAILELVAFVVARKLLKPDLSTVDIALGAAAFVGLLAARRFLLPLPPLEAGFEEKEPKLEKRD